MQTFPHYFLDTYFHKHNKTLETFKFDTNSNVPKSEKFNHSAENYVVVRYEGLYMFITLGKYFATLVCTGIRAELFE